ncbi:MAG: polysaccharide biosynthesis tyrosine autokinase [Ignavibacteria bacterium]|nr:polysaccharide biosynthesis tyrosine autokinase [Ignavibacteria bacterium]
MNNISKKLSKPDVKEKSLAEIFHILYKRKWVIIISIFLAVSIAYFYSKRSIPIYQSTVVLKKEMASKSNLDSGLMEIVRMQTQDEVETEMQLVRTVDVLSKVVKELNLFIHCDKLITSTGKEIILNKSMFEYLNPKFNLNQLPFVLPQFVSIDLSNFDQSEHYYVTRESENDYSIYNANTQQIIQTVKTPARDSYLTKDSPNDSIADISYSSGSFLKLNSLIFNTTIAKINLNWSEVPVGSKFYFTFNSFNGAITGLNGQISVGRTGQTNIFSISITSPSRYAAAVLANTLVNKFRDSRIEQQKQTIRYSFNFIDDQLQEMQSKLRESEDNLSSFKSNSQITTIDANSGEVVRFLSDLEAERMSTELKLNEYRNKLEDMKKQLEKSGYFDQNLLSPEGTGSPGSPFATLLEQLSDLELSRLELLQKRTENHPDVISLDERISLAKEKLATYNLSTLTAYQILINTLDKKRQDINNMMSKYEVKLERLPAQENKFARLFREKSVYEKMFTLLLDKREEMRMAELSKLQDIIVVDPAREAVTPKGPKKLFTILIGCILGSFIGIILIFVLELKNSKLINLDEIEQDFNIPVLSIIPKYTRAIKNKIANTTDIREKFVNLIDEQNGFKETYSLLRTKLELRMLDKKKIFMITSCEEDSGKSTIVGNLAVSFAQNSKHVLIIDCDLRKAGVSRIFELTDEKGGLIDYLSTGTLPKIHTRVSKLIDILPTGGLTLDSSNLLNSERMEDLVNLIDTSVYDFVIIDTPPVTRVVDTLILGKFFKDAVLVVRPDMSLKENVKEGLKDMADAKIKIRGLVVNAAVIEKSYYYKHRYGYGYGYGSDNGKNKRTKLRGLKAIKKVYS